MVVYCGKITHHHLHHTIMLSNIPTWTYVQLLGPCYKTGRATPDRLQWVDQQEKVDTVSCKQLTENSILLLSIQLNVNAMASFITRHTLRSQLVVARQLNTCCSQSCCLVQPIPLCSPIQQVQISSTPFSKLCLTFPTWYLFAISLR